jgi:hypothetical protein
MFSHKVDVGDDAQEDCDLITHPSKQTCGHDGRHPHVNDEHIRAGVFRVLIPRSPGAE